ncbi:MAG: STAS/SEC14 domain-containing protein [Pseudomonadota bacterium]
MIAINAKDNLISVSVMGEFTLADYKDFEQQVLHNIEFQGGVYLLLDLRDMVSYTLDVAWEEIRFSLKHRYDFRKIAVVTGDEWMVWIAWLNSLFTDAEIRVFDEPGIALDWLEGRAP